MRAIRSSVLAGNYCACTATQVLLAHLTVWELADCKILLEPLLVPHADYYSGLTLQLHILQSSSGATSLVAVGAHSSRMCCLQRHIKTLVAIPVQGKHVRKYDVPMRRRSIRRPSEIAVARVSRTACGSHAGGGHHNQCRKAGSGSSAGASTRARTSRRRGRLQRSGTHEHVMKMPLTN